MVSVGTIFRQTQFAEFEHAIHKKQIKKDRRPAQFLNELYADEREILWSF